MKNLVLVLVFTLMLFVFGQTARAVIPNSLPTTSAMAKVENLKHTSTVGIFVSGATVRGESFYENVPANERNFKSLMNIVLSADLKFSVKNPKDWVSVFVVMYDTETNPNQWIRTFFGAVGFRLDPLKGGGYGVPDWGKEINISPVPVPISFTDEIINDVRIIIRDGDGNVKEDRHLDINRDNNSFFLPYDLIWQGLSGEVVVSIYDPDSEVGYDHAYDIGTGRLLPSIDITEEIIPIFDGVVIMAPDEMGNIFLESNGRSLSIFVIETKVEVENFYRLGVETDKGVRPLNIVVDSAEGKTTYVGEGEDTWVIPLTKGVHRIYFIWPPDKDVTSVEGGGAKG